MRVVAVIVANDGEQPDRAELDQLRAAFATPEYTVVRPAPLVSEIVARVGHEMGIAAREIVSDSRTAPHSRARFAVCWLARRCTGKSASIIGRALGDRDHSTVIHAIRRAEELRGRDRNTRRLRDPAFSRLTDRLLAEFMGEQA